LAELYQTVAALNEAAMTAVTVYLTVVSAYIIAAYIAGKELEKSQLTIISSLFVVFASFFSFSSYQFFAASISLVVSETNTGYPSLPYLLLIAEIVGILAALKFMLDIRKVDDGS